MWPFPQEPADLDTFNDETLNGKLHFLYVLLGQNILISKIYGQTEKLVLKLEVHCDICHGVFCEKWITSN